MPSTRARTCATRKALVRPGNSVTTGTVVGWTVTTPTSGVCCGGAECFGPHAASNMAAVAALIKRNGTRSTRMERPLSMTENEKVRASLPRGRRRTHASCDARPKAHGCRQQLRGNLNQMRHTGKCRTAPPVEARRVSVLKTTVTDINRSSQLGLSDRGVLLYIHSRMDVKVR